MSVRDPQPRGVRAVADRARVDPLELRRPGGPTGHTPGGPRGPVSRPDPTAARLAAGMVGAAATTAIIAAIVGGTSSASAAVTTGTTDTPAATSAQAQVPVRHVTQYVTIPSNATPPPRKVVYATPVPAPPQRVVVVTTTQSGRVVP